MIKILLFEPPVNLIYIELSSLIELSKHLINSPLSEGETILILGIDLMAPISSIDA